MGIKFGMKKQTTKRGRHGSWRMCRPYGERKQKLGWKKMNERMRKMKEQTIFKAITTAAMGVLHSIFGILAIPILLMVGSNVIDYITGLIASKYRQQPIESYKGFKGIAKKVCMWLLVAVGAIIDQLILFTSDTFGFDFKIKFLVAGIVAIWIICNEIISILENMIDIGVKIPTFLVPLAQRIIGQMDKVSGVDAEQGSTLEERGEK